MPDVVRVAAELDYAGKRYTVVQEWAWAHRHGFDYAWREGNYSCDCNRSQFIQEQCSEDFPEMPCGERIRLVSLTTDPDVDPDEYWAASPMLPSGSSWRTPDRPHRDQRSLWPQGTWSPTS